MRRDELTKIEETQLPAPMPARRAAALPANPERSAPDANSVLRAMGRRLVPAIALGVVAAAAAGAAAWSLIPPGKFKSQAMLQIFAEQPRVLFSTADDRGSGSQDYIRYQQTQATLVKSRFVLNAALRRDGVARCGLLQETSDPVDWLQANLEVDFVRNSELMAIALAGNAPKDLALIVNAVKDAYMEEVVEIQHRRRIERNDVLNTHNKLYGDLLKNRRAALKKLAESVGSDDRQTLAFKQQIAMEHTAVVRKELLEIESRRRKLEARLKTRVEGADVEETSARDVAGDELARAVEEHPEMVGLRMRVVELEERLASERAYQRKVARRPATDPALNRLVNEVASLKAALGRKREELRPAVRQAMIDGRVREDDTDVVEARRELSEMEFLEERLRDQLERLTANNQDLSLNTLGIQEIQDEIAQYQATAARIGSEVEALKVELEAPPRVRLIEDAAVPTVKSDKKRYMTTAMAVLGAFAASLVGMTMLELRSQRIDDVDAVHADVGLAVMGALPRLPSRARGEIVRRKDRLWHARLLESIDATRLMLVHAARNRAHRVVMIASALPDEGKTSLASHLATSLARAGLKTLLIDADLRNASIHKLFDLPPEPGLSELLRGEVGPLDVAGATGVDGLSVVVAGRCDSRTIQALARGGLAEVFRGYKLEYDFVIVDSSPILPVADALLVAQQADAVLFSIFQDVSRRSRVLAAVERLERLDVELLGAVVTGIDDHSRDYRGYGGYEAYAAPVGGDSCDATGGEE